MAEREFPDLADVPLADLLIGAAEAPPNERIRFRNRIAAHGAEAARALESWLVHPDLAAFAVRTIGKAADVDWPAAVAGLRNGLSRSITTTTRQDIEAELQRLGARPAATRPPRVGSKKARTPATGSPDDLVPNRVYGRRAELHPLLGGNQQKGISYPADDVYALLFSDPGKVAEHGYNDRWDGADAYWYFGEWDGPGDMTMSGGNAEIVGRSPQLHLFIAAPGGHRYVGRFRCDGHKSELARHESRDFNAIVFHLVRATG